MVGKLKYALHSHPRLITWVVLILLFIAFFAAFGEGLIGAAIAKIKALAGEAPGGAVYVAAAGFTILAALLPIPAEAPAFLNGTIFPPLNAFVLTYAFTYLGASLAYEGGRYLGHGPVSRIFGDRRMAKIEAFIGTAGWPTMLALRLSPVMAFTALNWASGILALSRPIFYWTTAVGIAPGTYIFTLAPQVLENDASFGMYLGAAFAFVAMLLGLGFLRFKRARKVAK